MRASATTTVEKPIRVLLADDDAAFLESLVPLIESQSQLTVVGAAKDGLAALELAARLEPDAVVIDLHMPRLDGVGAITQLRGDHPSLCLIALTGDETPQLHAAVREAGADAVFLKHDFFTGLVDRLSTAVVARAV